MTRALAEGTEDGRLFLHAGVIAAAGDRRAEARKWLRKPRHCDRCCFPLSSMNWQSTDETVNTGEELRHENNTA